MNSEKELIFESLLKAAISSKDKEGPLTLLFSLITWIVLLGHPLQKGAPTDKLPSVPIT